MTRVIVVFFLFCSFLFSSDEIFKYLDSCQKADLQKLSKLLTEQTNLKIYDKYGDTLLTKLTKNLQNCDHNLQIAKLIIDKDRKILDMPDKNGDTPLIVALRKDKDKYLPKLFIKEGAEINIASKKDGKTPLMLAVLHKDDEMVRILSDRFAKRGLKDKNGKTALDYAIKDGDIKIAQKVYADKKGKFVFFDKDNKPLFMILTKKGFRLVKSPLDTEKILFAYVDSKIYKKICNKKLKNLKIIAMINYNEKLKDYGKSCNQNIKLVKFNEEFYNLLLKALRWRTPPMMLLRDKDGNIISSGINEKFLKKLK